MLLIIEQNLTVTLVSGCGAVAVPEPPAPARACSQPSVLPTFRFPLKTTENNNCRDAPNTFDLPQKQGAGTGFGTCQQDRPPQQTGSGLGLSPAATAP